MGPRAQRFGRGGRSKKLADMPAQAGSKRVKGVSIYRPFVFGSIARPFDPSKKPANVPPEHTHQWTVWVKGVNDVDITYWLKKVQFKLHDTYENSLRTLDAPPFEVTETGWGEFDIQIKLHFVPESHEKPQTTWHTLKLHPYGPNAEIQKEQRQPIMSQNYEEIIFNEPVENFYDILTGGNDKAGKGKALGKGQGKSGSKAAQAREKANVAELPDHPTPGNPYSLETEGKECDRLRDALKKVEELISEETVTLKEKEELLKELRGPDTTVSKKK